MTDDVDEAVVEPDAAPAADLPTKPKRKINYAELWRVVSMYEESAFLNARDFPDPRGEMEHRQACLVKVLELIRLVEKHDKAFRKIIADAEAKLTGSRGKRGGERTS